MEKEIEKKNNKSNKVLIIIMVVLILISIGLFSYDIFINKSTREENKNSVVKPTPTPDEKEIDTNLSSDDIYKLLDDTIYYYNYRWNYYKEDKALVSKLDYKTKMQIILDVILDKYGETTHDDLDDSDVNWTTYSMKKDAFEKEFYNYFGDDVKYEFETIKGLKNVDSNYGISKMITTDISSELTKVDIGSEITFDGDDVILRRLDCCGDHSIWKTSIKPITLKEGFTIDGDKLYITERPAFIKNDGDTTLLYKDSEYKEFIDEYTKDSDYDNTVEFAESMINYLDAFKYTYVLNEDKSYRLVSIEKIEDGMRYVKPIPTPTPTPKAPLAVTGEELDVNSDLVKKLHNLSMPVDDFYEGKCSQYYANESFSIKNLNIYKKAHIVLNSLGNDDDKIIVKKDVFEKTYLQIFGEKIDDLNSIVDQGGIIEINSDGDIIYNRNREIGDIGIYSMNTYLYKASKDKENIYLYEKPIFANVMFSTNIDVDIYDGCNIETAGVLERLSTNRNPKFEDASDYLIPLVTKNIGLVERLSTYKFTFKDNGDGSYQFVSIEKIKEE